MISRRSRSGPDQREELTTASATNNEAPERRETRRLPARPTPTRATPRTTIATSRFERGTVSEPATDNMSETEPSATASQTVRRLASRLPRPMPRATRRTDIVLRPGQPTDTGACLALDASYATTHIWQMDSRRENDELRVSFRSVRLPRELNLSEEHHPPAVTATSHRRGLLWLVAEEIEHPAGGGSRSIAERRAVREPESPSSPTSGGAHQTPRPGTPQRTPQSGEERARGAPGTRFYSAPAESTTPRPSTSVTWNHEVKRSRGASSIQLGLPATSGAAGYGTARPGRDPGTTGASGAHGADEIPGSDEASDGYGGDHSDDTAPRQTSRIVGYVAIAAASRDERAYLRTLVVARTHRRKGVAARLMAEARHWAVDQGAEYLIADISARNYPALRFLQKQGFAFCGYNDRCYPNNEVAIFFTARLR